MVVDAIPFLARLGERPAECPTGPILSVGTDGLLRRDGETEPFITELMATRDSYSMRSAAMLSILTKAQLDPPDPDAIRRDFNLRSGGLHTFVTRAEGEQSDPDVVRANGCWAMATSYTSGGKDKPDPDWIRRS